MTDVPVPSYRVRPTQEGPPWRMIAMGGGLATALAVGAAIAWGLSQSGGPRSVPLIEADPRPFKVRPEDPGGLRVPNQDELIFERNRAGQVVPSGARLAPEPEAPRLDALRAQVAQPPPVASPQPAAPPPAAAAPQPATPAAPAPAQAPAPAARPAPAPNGAIRVQLGALTSEDAARGEWDRVARLHADLFGAFRPQVLRFEREGQPTLFRLRTGGFADIAAAQAFCEQVRARRLPCQVIR